MSLQSAKHFREDQELVTPTDLIACAHALMGGIDLDVASSKRANKHVEAPEYFSPQDDGLNLQQWFGSVYLFPPAGCYFWDKKNDKWSMTRGSSPP